MTTILRKLFVLAMIAVVLVLASIYEVVRWLTHLGIPEMAEDVRDRYLTGTTIAIVLALVLLLRSDRARHRRHLPPYEPPGDPFEHYPPEYYPPPRPRRYREWW